MSRVDAAAPMDRLPWLSDEPKPLRQSTSRKVPLIAGSVAVVAVAGAGFWMGARSINDQVPTPARHGQATTTVRLPAPRAAVPEVKSAPEREIRLAPVPEVRPAPPREVHLASPVAEKSSKPEALPSARQAPPAAVTAKPSTAIPATPPAKPFVMQKPWPPRVIAGASGRLVQVGAFGSIRQAKRGWWFMVRAYPAMAHLPAVVRPTRNSKGRVFYRFQVGTTSQAHSEVLCQRMSKIDLSCAVVGLPWKAKVER